jgi:ABC-type branched-subunit amino acid transport system substrate-binding protein
MRRWCAAAASVAAALMLVACGNAAQQPTDPRQHQPGQVYFYGSDGNMLNGTGDLVTANHPNALMGMKGTTPLTPLSQSFRDRLHQIDPTLQDYTYAGESYDAVVITALAAQIAGSAKSADIAAQINGVTIGHDICDTPAQCLSLIKAGHDVRYRGITLGLGGFTDEGEPSAATYGILRFGQGNKIDASLTQYVPAGNPSSATQKKPPAGTPDGQGHLKIGALLPHTGDLASAGPALFAGTKLGIKEVNDAGGVLGAPVEYVDGDDYTDPKKAQGTVNDLLADGVQVIIGAGASSISLAVLPSVIAAGVVLFSPSNTSAALSTVDDHGLYFRTAPPDGLQAAALADIISRDGVRKIAVIYRGDSYGGGLANSVKDDLVKAGLSGDAITLIKYDPAKTDTDFVAIGKQVRDLNPDGVLMVAFDETSKIVDGLNKNGISSITN